MTKKTKTETLAAPAADAQPVADVQPAADEPRDAEGMEAVTVLVMAADPEHTPLTVAGVRKFLKGVHAEVLTIAPEQRGDTDIETLRRVLPMVQTERVVVIGDGQLLLQPVTLYDCAQLTTLYGRKPQMYHKSVLLPLLEELATDKPYADVAAEYFARVLHGVTPLPVGDWRTDPWLLPVVSEQPSVHVIGQYLSRKKFAAVSPQSWTSDVLAFFSRLYE